MSVSTFQRNVLPQFQVTSLLSTCTIPLHLSYDNPWQNSPLLSRWLYFPSVSPTSIALIGQISSSFPIWPTHFSSLPLQHPREPQSVTLEKGSVRSSETSEHWLATRAETQNKAINWSLDGVMTDNKSVSLLFRPSAILRCLVRWLLAEVSIEYTAGIFKVQVVFLDSPR